MHSNAEENPARYPKISNQSKATLRAHGGGGGGKEGQKKGPLASCQRYRDQQTHRGGRISIKKDREAVSIVLETVGINAWIYASRPHRERVTTFWKGRAFATPTNISCAWSLQPAPSLPVRCGPWGTRPRPRRAPSWRTVSDPLRSGSGWGCHGFSVSFN